MFVMLSSIPAFLRKLFPCHITAATYPTVAPIEPGVEVLEDRVVPAALVPDSVPEFSHAHDGIHSHWDISDYRLEHPTTRTSGYTTEVQDYRRYPFVWENGRSPGSAFYKLDQRAPYNNTGLGLGYTYSYSLDTGLQVLPQTGEEVGEQRLFRIYYNGNAHASTADDENGSPIPFGQILSRIQVQVGGQMLVDVNEADPLGFDERFSGSALVAAAIGSSIPLRMTVNAAATGQAGPGAHHGNYPGAGNNVQLSILDATPDLLAQGLYIVEPGAGELTALFDYRVQLYAGLTPEEIPDTSIWFYWATGSGVEDRIALAHEHAITTTEQKTSGSHSGEWNFASSSVPEGATALQMVIDEEDTVPERNGSQNNTGIAFLPRPQIFLSQFSHSGLDAIDRVGLTYDVSGFSGPVDIGIFSSEDQGLQSFEDPEIFRFTLSPEAIRESMDSGGPVVGLLDANGSVLSVDHALTPGRHTVLIDPAKAGGLRSALESGRVETLWAAANPENPEIAIPFRGLYQHEDGSRLVARSDPWSEDVVTVERDSLTFRSFQFGFVEVAPAETIELGSAADVLIVTSAGNDSVIAGSDVTRDLIVHAGDGFDLVLGGNGNDEIYGGGGVDVLVGDGFGFDLEGPELTDFLTALREKRIELAKVEITPGSGSDRIQGGEGFDVLIGGLGDHDVLEAGPGGSIIFADGLAPTAALSFDFSELLENPSLENARKALTEGLRLESEISLPGDGRNRNTIHGGNGFDLVIGGNGTDAISTGGGVDVVFGFRGNDAIAAEESDYSIVLAGAGHDTVTGASGVNLLVGGDGDDVLTGGNGIDVVLGDGFHFTLNGESFTGGLAELHEGLEQGRLTLRMGAEAAGSGRDTLYGRDGFDVLIGGDDSDRLIGGDGGGILFGDSFHFEVGPDVDLSEIFEGSEGASDSDAIDQQTKARSLWSKALELMGAPDLTLLGEGNDEIIGGSGIDLVVGGKGNDVADGGGGFVDVMIGNEGDDTLTGHTTLLNLMMGGDGSDRLEGSQLEDSPGGILIGDAFDYQGLPVNLASAFNIEFAGLLPSKVELAGGWTESGNGNDTIVGAENGFNLLLGGGGDDIIEGQGFFDFILGDSFNLGLDVGVTLDYSTLSWTGLTDNFDAIQTRFQLPGLSGNGNDVISGEDGYMIALAGGGNDYVCGSSGPLDLLFGNDGDDVIHGRGGFNVIVGGGNATPGGLPRTVPECPVGVEPRDGGDVLIGGDDGNLILGDSLTLVGGGLLDLNALKGGELSAEPGTGLVAAGNGNDLLRGGDGLDFLVGGDGDDEIHGGNGINVALGDAFQLANSFNFPLELGAAAITALVTSDVEPLLIEVTEALGLVGEGNDAYYGGVDTDVVFGGNGNDRLRGGEGWDFLVGGFGDDRVDGGDTDAILPGDEGDVVLGGPGDDELFGGPGNDHLESEAGQDVFHGGPGNDRIFGGADADVLFGEEGDDQLYGENGDDTLIGGPGDDLLDGGAGSNNLIEDEAGAYVVNGVLTVVGTEDRDQVHVRRVGGETIRVVAGFLDGKRYRDFKAATVRQIDIRLLGGNDGAFVSHWIVTPAFIDGGSGHDVIRGGSGHDLLLGGAGNDIVLGGSGHDLLIGGEGWDVLFGGWGRDLLIGGTTAYDQNRDALMSLSRVWSVATDSAGGRQILQDEEQPYYLRFGETVFDDGASDWLFVLLGHDWALTR